MKEQTVRLVVLGRGRQSYGTRVLTAGEEFEMPRGIADTLIRIGKAKLAGGEPTPRPAPSPPKPPPPPQEPEPDEDDNNEPAEPAPSRSGGDEIEPLRAKARELGIMVDRRWGIPRLHYEIKRAQRG
jgi:hypothetical protein